MALHYNLAKVYALSNDEDAFVQEKIQYFVFEIPKLIENLKETIDEKIINQWLKVQLKLILIWI